jgi:hypothetical protein
MSEAQSKREAERRLRQPQLEGRRRTKERLKEMAERKPDMDQIRKQRRLLREQARKEKDKEIEKSGGFACYFAKIALGESEERWQLIQPKLKKMKDLRDQATSTVGTGVTDGPSDSRTGPSVPRLKWERSWKDKPLSELTEAQRLARQLRTLLERKDTTPHAFSRKIAALRKARSKEAEIGRQLTEARRELRQILTTREEVILVLLGWL